MYLPQIHLTVLLIMLLYLFLYSANEVDSQPIVNRMAVQSSYKLKLPPHLIVPSSSLKLVETIGQG